jgi:Fur family transcriptional regulator, ferric uptake regulator
MHNWHLILSQQGYRITSPRRAVATVLLEAEVPLTAQEILDAGRECHSGLGLVTVYRTLELYEELGLVSRVHLPEGCHGYVATTPGHRHVLICQRCGRSVEFRGRGDLDALVAEIERQTGYQVRGHLLQLSGICPVCSHAER